MRKTGLTIAAILYSELETALGWYLPSVMKDTPKPDICRTYDAAFRAEALRLAEQSCSTQVAARALNIDPKRLYQCQKAAQTPVAAALDPALDPATAAELRQLRALARRQAQELGILKKLSPAPASCAGSHRRWTNEPLPFHQRRARPLPGKHPAPYGAGLSGSPWPPLVQVP